MTAPPVGAFDLGVAAALVVVNAGLSWWLRARLARTLLVAAARAIVQLLLVGLVLKTVFALDSPWLVALVVAVMLASASHEILARQERRFAGAWRYGPGAGTTALATLIVTALGVSLLGPRPWYEPQVVIPLAGIILGTVMNSVSLALNGFNDALARERGAIEARLALGATRRDALAPVMQASLRGGLIPIVNQMSAAGIVTLPGLMTGQILAGMAPFEAAKSQILILLLLAGAGGLGAFATIALAAWRATDERHRLRLDRLEAP